MEKTFNSDAIGKTKEEIFNINKEITLSNIKSTIKFDKEQIEKSKEYHKNVSNDITTQLYRAEKSLQNIDETTKAVMRKRALDLYNRVQYLNDVCKDRSSYNKNKTSYINAAADIHAMINGYGEESEALYQQIINTPNFDPEIAMQRFASWLGIDVISPKKYASEEAMLHQYDTEARADLMIKANFNCYTGLLTETKEEIIERLNKELESTNHIKR